MTISTFKRHQLAVLALSKAAFERFAILFAMNRMLDYSISGDRTVVAVLRAVCQAECLFARSTIEGQEVELATKRMLAMLSKNHFHALSFVWLHTKLRSALETQQRNREKRAQKKLEKHGL